MDDRLTLPETPIQFTTRLGITWGQAPIEEDGAVRNAWNPAGTRVDPALFQRQQLRHARMHAARYPHGTVARELRTYTMRRRAWHTWLRAQPRPVPPRPQPRARRAPPGRRRPRRRIRVRVRAPDAPPSPSEHDRGTRDRVHRHDHYGHRRAAAAASPWGSL